MMYKILIIDDEKDLLSYLADALSETYQVSTCSDPLGVHDLVVNNSYDLLILDINMPKLNGLELGAQIRSVIGYESLPLIYLTGQNESASRTACYQVGGDNFISKPFELTELKAIIEHHCKKSKTNNKTHFSFGDISMSPLNHYCSVNGEEIILAHKEYQILLFFIQHPDQILSREVILEKVWKDNVKVSDRTIDSHVSTLRKKLHNSTCSIKSIYQEGYIFSK